MTDQSPKRKHPYFYTHHHIKTKEIERLLWIKVWDIG